MIRTVALVLLAAGCSFSPDLGEGTIRCSVTQACPPELRCAPDGLCYHEPAAAALDGAAALDLAQPAAPDLAQPAALDLAQPPSPPDLAKPDKKHGGPGG